MTRINDNYGIVGLSEPKQSQSETTNGVSSGKNVTAPDKPQHSLANLPPLAQSEIFKFLDLRSVSSLERASRLFQGATKQGDTLAKNWYGRFPSSHQAQLKTILSNKDDKQLTEWLQRFTDDEALIDSVMKRRESVYFPALFFFTVSKVMSQCKTFKLETTSISHNSSINSASLSADGRHMITVGDDHRVKIYALGEDGTLEEKLTISHSGRIKLARFSDDGSKVVTISDDHSVKILGQEVDGSWQEKITIHHTGNIRTAELSPDGSHLVTASDDHTAKIYGQNVDGSWEEKTTIFHTDKVNSATFSADNKHVVTTSDDHTVKIHSHKAGGSWVEKTTISNNGLDKPTIFSADGCRAVTFSSDNTAKIYQKLNGLWVEEDTILHNAPMKSASFSDDGRHLIILSGDNRLRMCLCH